MTLTQIARARTPVFKAAPGFNEKAAREAYDLVMKMDEAEARSFVEIVVSEILEETIAKNQRVLQRHLNRVVSKRMTDMKRATARAIVKTNDPQAIAFAESLVEIEKAYKNPYETGAYAFQESDFNRGSDGRFRTKIRLAGNIPLNDKTAEASGIRPPREKNPYAGMKPYQKAHYQQEYAQLANFLGTVRDSIKSPGDVDLYLHYRDRRTNEEFTEKVSGTTEAKPEFLRPYDPNIRLTSVEANPTSLNIGGAAFGLTSALGANGPGVRNAAEGMNRYEKAFPEFSQSWLAPSDSRNSNERLYNRVAAGSALVGAVSNDPRVQIASAFGQFVGSHGPEAEKVVGPTVRRTAYRYRGTSKPPDLQLARDYNTSIVNAKVTTDVGDRDMGMVQQAARRQNALRRNSSWDERGGGREVIADYLQRRAPKKGLYNLQLASGNTPPSEGVIINADGRITDQAVGYGDDHYLPFNLRKLRELRGGEYIRTRSVGGPTTEDIYTGLMAGAKQVTVISRSGTFTVTFEDDFKGGRRYNDKALRMTKRYAQILDAVQSQQVDRMDISPDIRAAITAKVRDETKGWGLSGKEVGEAVQRRVQDFKDSPELGDDEYELASYMSRQMQVRADRGEVPQRDVDDFRNSVMSDLAAEKEYKFRLNGAGYAAALEALREQFPYYITSNSVPRREERHETELDRGYVEPGRNRPTAAAAGLFGAKTQHPYKESQGKFSAADANYQGKGRPRPGGGTEEDAKLKATGDKKPDIKNKVEEVKQQVAFQTVAQKIQTLAKAPLASELDKHPQLTYTPEDLKDAAKQAEFVKFTEMFFAKAREKNFPIPQDLKVEWAKASGRIGQEVYSADSHRGLWGNKPYKFTGEGTDVKRVALIDQKTHSGIASTKKLSEMSDGELQTEHATAVAAKALMGSMGDLNPDSKVEMLRDVGVTQNTPGLLRAMKSAQGFDEHMDAVHEMRALRQGVPETERSGPIVVKPAEKTDEDRKGPRQGVEDMAQTYTEMSQYLADKGDKYEAGVMAEAAMNLKKALQQGKVLGPGDAAGLIDSEQEAANIRHEHWNEWQKHRLAKGGFNTTGILRSSDD